MRNIRMLHVLIIPAAYSSTRQLLVMHAWENPFPFLRMFLTIFAEKTEVSF
jgi:hypothetical protein